MTRARQRVLAVAALLVVALALILVLLRDDDARPYHLLVENAGQLVKGDEVQVGGVPVGSIADIALTSDNQARISIEVEPPYAPLHEGTTGEIRVTSLSGVANRYVALRPGANNAPELPDGGTLGTEATTGVVDLDQLFDTFDPRTRRALQRVVQGSATQFAGESDEYAGAARDLRGAARSLAPALSSAGRLERELLRDEAAFSDFLVETGRTLGVLSSRKDELGGFVDGAATTLDATASESRALGEAVGELPAALRSGEAAFDELDRTLPDLRRLVRATRPATGDLAPFARELTGLLERGTPVLRDLRLALDRPRSPALVDATRLLPDFDRALVPAARHGIPALRELAPMLRTIRPYAPDVGGALRGFGQAGAFYDANGHYARVVANFNRFRVDESGALRPNESGLGTLQPAGPRRCPGSAAAPAADGSTPFADSPPILCELSEVPPGP
jgi:phospholipid/cholesterol/gamma-HCH transport system substrate-binding protein